MNFSTDIKTLTARKEHDCCCYDIYLASGYGVEDTPLEYWSVLHDMRFKNGMIQVGEEYVMWSGVFEGEFFTARANKRMHDLICEMEWFDD